MDASFINSFIQGAQNVLTTVCKETPSLGKVFVKKTPYVAMPITITLSITGQLSGEVVYNMNESDAIFIASAMMMGMPVASLDAIAQSAVSEATNMISGNVATLFYNKKIQIDITPPRFKLNAGPEDFPLTSKVEKVVCVPLHFTSGECLEIDIVLP